MDARATAIGWMVLAPATMIAAWLDIWLENGEPHPLSQGRARTDTRWAIPVLAGSAVFLSGWLVHGNLKQTLVIDPEVRVPGTSGATTVNSSFGHRIPVDVEVDGSYQIVAKTNQNEKITLFLIQDTGVKSADDPPSLTEKLKKDSKYFICVMPEATQTCSLPLATIRDFDMLVINGNIDIHATHTISISSVRSQ